MRPRLLDAIVARIERNRRLLDDVLQREAPQVRHRPGQATPVAWLDFRATGLGDGPAAVLLERGQVALSPGPTFGLGGAGHARIDLATCEPVLREALDRIVEVLASAAARTEPRSSHRPTSPAAPPFV